MAEEYIPSDVKLGEVNDDVLKIIGKPSRFYLLSLFVLFGGIGTALITWITQVKTGMGVTGLDHPVGWAAYIGNFVFWVGIAHSGTLISAILYLVRAKFRDAVSRAAEAMTVFAVMTAGLFPLIHLGRLWVFYYIVPYPSERLLWPNFKSPLVWDLMAVLTYFTVSVIFFYVGLIPDAAAARDRSQLIHGRDHIKTKFFRILALGWNSSIYQWHHYGRAYLFFAALATPLVVSVHSIVSWDFAVGILPGWHSTLFAPYFVAGAIHSGLAMVLTLLIPLSIIMNLEKIITVKHFEMIAKIIVVTGAIVGYSYLIEPMTGFFKGSIFDVQFIRWRVTDGAFIFYMLILFNFLIPMSFVIKKVRQNLIILFVISLVINAGMWTERFFIVSRATEHDFLPHAWGSYSMSIVEILITAGSFAFFFFWFFVFSKYLPVIPLADYKKQAVEKTIKAEDGNPSVIKAGTPPAKGIVLKAIFTSAADLMSTVKDMLASGFTNVQVYTPVRLKELEIIMGFKKSPVRVWTLIGSVGGFIFGYYLAIATSEVFNLVVHGKQVVALIPYLLIAFEMMVLFGTIFNLIGVIYHAKLNSFKMPVGYDLRFTKDKFGIEVSVDDSTEERIRNLLTRNNAEEVSKM